MISDRHKSRETKTTCFIHSELLLLLAAQHLQGLENDVFRDAGRMRLGHSLQFLAFTSNCNDLLWT